MSNNHIDKIKSGIRYVIHGFWWKKKELFRGWVRKSSAQLAFIFLTVLNFFFGQTVAYNWKERITATMFMQ